MSLTDGIIGCWSPSLGASGYRLLDRSRYSNHGTLTNMDAGTDWTGTPVGLSLDYDGTNDYVELLRCPLFSSGAVMFAASIWFRTNSTAIDNDYNMLWSNAGGNPPGNNGIDIWCDDRGFGTDNTRRNGIAAAWKTTTGSYAGVGVNDVIAGDAWRHLVIAWDRSTPMMYLDGAATGAKWAGTSGTGDFVGRATAPNIARLSGGTGEFPGQIGEVAIFNRPLAAAEVRELYRRGNGAIGRELTGQTRRRTYGFVAATGARRRRIITGMV
jgi:hypothetical protein